MSWKDKDKWQAMVSGEDCPMCADLHLEENPHSFLIAELPYSYVRLPKNQYPYGLALVALKRHATEMYELGEGERAGFFKEVAIVSKAVKVVFKPVKIYYGIFGARCPHFHCHLMPQNMEDDPFAPLAINQKKVTLESSEYSNLINKLRSLILE